MRTGTKGGSIAFLGIDGSGKSSHSSVTGDWLRQRGYQCDIMPFHRYLFVEQLASISSALRKRSSGRSANGEGTAAPAAACRRRRGRCDGRRPSLPVRGCHLLVPLLPILPLLP